jgi:outer membrane protein OmpA-like peptidoglycan-associated protein
MAVKAQQQEREQAERKAAEEREAKARLEAAIEGQRRLEAEQARVRAEQERQAAEAAKAEAERIKQQAELAAQQAAQAAAEAARQKQEADAARAAALAQQEQLKAQAEQARQAMEQSEKLRQQAEQEKAELRARLLAQLNQVLDTHESARGLIANMGDVLFETGRYELKPMARERLAKVSGILLAYPSLKVSIEGHTDAIGGDDFNQTLSERRAQSVRDYFMQQGVPDAMLSARGFGKTQPIASNDTPDGRQRNRRVELVVSGDAIGVKTTAAGGPASQ